MEFLCRLKMHVQDMQMDHSPINSWKQQPYTAFRRQKDLPSWWDYKDPALHYELLKPHSGRNKEGDSCSVRDEHSSRGVEGKKPFCDKTQKCCFSANAISYIFVAWWAQQHSWSVASDGNCSAPCHTWLCPHTERGTDPMIAVTVAWESEATLIHSQPPLPNCLQPNNLFRIIHELITLEEKNFICIITLDLKAINYARAINTAPG